MKRLDGGEIVVERDVLSEQALLGLIGDLPGLGRGKKGENLFTTIGIGFEVFSMEESADMHSLADWIDGRVQPEIFQLLAEHCQVPKSFAKCLLENNIILLAKEVAQLLGTIRSSQDGFTLSGAKAWSKSINENKKINNKAHAKAMISLVYLFEQFGFKLENTEESIVFFQDCLQFVPEFVALLSEITEEEGRDNVIKCLLGNEEGVVRIKLKGGEIISHKFSNKAIKQRIKKLGMAKIENPWESRFLRLNDLFQKIREHGEGSNIAHIDFVSSSEAGSAQATAMTDEASSAVTKEVDAQLVDSPEQETTNRHNVFASLGLSPEYFDPNHEYMELISGVLEEAGIDPNIFNQLLDFPIAEEVSEYLEKDDITISAESAIELSALNRGQVSKILKTLDSNTEQEKERITVGLIDICRFLKENGVELKNNDINSTRKVQMILQFIPLLIKNLKVLDQLKSKRDLKPDFIKALINNEAGVINIKYKGHQGGKLFSLSLSTGDETALRERIQKGYSVYQSRLATMKPRKEELREECLQWLFRLLDMEAASYAHWANTTQKKSLLYGFEFIPSSNAVSPDEVKVEEEKPKISFEDGINDQFDEFIPPENGLLDIKKWQPFEARIKTLMKHINSLEEEEKSEYITKLVELLSEKFPIEAFPIAFGKNISGANQRAYQYVHFTLAELFSWSGNPAYAQKLLDRSVFLEQKKNDPYQPNKSSKAGILEKYNQLKENTEISWGVTDHPQKYDSVVSQPALEQKINKKIPIVVKRAMEKVFSLFAVQGVGKYEISLKIGEESVPLNIEVFGESGNGRTKLAGSTDLWVNMNIFNTALSSLNLTKDDTIELQHVTKKSAEVVRQTPSPEPDMPLSGEAEVAPPVVEVSQTTSEPENTPSKPESAPTEKDLPVDEITTEEGRIQNLKKAREQRDALKKEVEKLKGEITDLEAQLKDLQSKVEADSKLENLRGNLKKMREEITEKDKQIEELKERKEGLEKQVTELGQQVQKQVDESLELAFRSEELKSQNDLLQKSMEVSGALTPHIDIELFPNFINQIEAVLTSLQKNETRLIITISGNITLEINYSDGDPFELSHILTDFAGIIDELKENEKITNITTS